MTVSAMLTLLVQGFGKSLEIFTLTLLGSLPLGLLVMFGRRSRVAPLRWLVKLFISVMRGTPLMLQLMVVYYGPFLLFDFTPPGNWRFGAVIVGFVINYAAYFAEIYRAGYESIPVGQFEAAQVLGYTGGQTFGRILLPQMIRRVLPPVTNEVITLVKDTSIARIISMQELIYSGYAFLKGSHGYSGLLWPIFFTGVYYLAFNGILTLLFGRIEKRLQYFS